MRVLNDREEKKEPVELGFFQIFSHALLCAVGLATFVFAPLPMILAQLRLAEPWPKVAGVIGAIVALTFLEVPMPAVVFGFVFSLFVADATTKPWSLWTILRNSTLVAVSIGLAIVFFNAQAGRMTIGAYWTSTIHEAIVQLQQGVKADSGIQWEALEAVVRFEGPFLFISGAMLSLWFSIGLGAHLGWFPEGHPLSGNELRKLQLPSWSSGLFAAVFLASLTGPVEGRAWASALLRPLGTLMFVQGGIVLSQMLLRKGAKPRTKTIIYSVSMLIGFYALAALGALSPWLGNARRKSILPQPTVATEA